MRRAVSGRSVALPLINAPVPYEAGDPALERFRRNWLVSGIGEAGQARLAAARVLVVGAGGLGSPVLLYLTAAGVGTIGICDSDVVEASNLQRQLLHGEGDVGIPKPDSAVRHLSGLNSRRALRALRARDPRVAGRAWPRVGPDRRVHG